VLETMDIVESARNNGN